MAGQLRGEPKGRVFPSSAVIILLVSLTLQRTASADKVLSRVVSTKYGKVQGIIRHHSRPSLPPVEVFLGVPYASPPVGDGRFTPTSSPLPWEHIRKADRLPPACPQPIWTNDQKGGVPLDVEDYYNGIKSVLQNQNEDCLYLNIYAPHDGGGDYAVIVYIHGDSFRMGSGNLYDGGTLASYGQVVVVTFNYRLGPLGFLNTSPGGRRNGVVSNQGLMDQLAALSWVQENILFFGGDPSRVTVVGHSTGAACVGYLLASPVVVPGLFHRAILMSGSALSPWAEVPDALSVTVRLAKMLNCSLPADLNRKHPETISCLRNISARQIVDAKMPRYKFASVYGPSVDGVVVAEHLEERLSRTLKERKISLLFGVTESDAYPELSELQISRGVSITERNRIFRTYVRNTYLHHLQEIYLAVAKEYTDWENPSQHPLQIRDWTIKALSDAAFLAPLIRFADVISSKADTFMYVFAHRDINKERIGSVFRSEVPLLFGTPFQDPLQPPSSHTPSSIPSSAKASPPSKIGANFTRTDAIVSEYIMRYWTNFAKSGHPDLPDEVRPILSFGDQSQLKNVTWELYDQIFEKYLEISSRPRIRDHYRAHKVALWNWLLPELEDAGSKYPEAESEVWNQSQENKYFIGPVRPLDPFRFLQSPRHTPSSATPPLNSPVNGGYLAPNVSAAQGSPSRELNLSQSNKLEKSVSLLDYTTALTLTVAIGLSLLVLNVILFAALLYKRDRSGLVAKLKYDGVSAQPLCKVDSSLRGTPTTTRESISPPNKDIQSTSDIHCTEFHTFPSHPDIVGDRNEEVNVHNNNSQATSQFIPPPPLLSAASTTPVGLEGEPRCFPEHFQEEIIQVDREGKQGLQPSDITEAQYNGIIGDVSFITDNTGSFQDLRLAKPYLNNQECLNETPCSVSTCSFSSSINGSSRQFSLANYPCNVNKFSTCSDHYPSSPCQYQGGLGFTTGVRFYGEKSYSDGSQDNHAKGGRSSRSATITKQSLGGIGGQTSFRKQLTPSRTGNSSSYATLPRQEQKELEHK